ncbi:MAG: hypothetical protein LBG80_20440 [Bacteroidales bacterium]|jgi:hypothetical protein|nr:hypothetical protein [Bacteroidales bacterium]
MEKDRKDIGFGYTPDMHLVGDSYQPIPPQGVLAKSFTPPKGGTGARTIELKTVNIPMDKKQEQ